MLALALSLTLATVPRQDLADPHTDEVLVRGFIEALAAGVALPEGLVGPIAIEIAQSDELNAWAFADPAGQPDGASPRASIGVSAPLIAVFREHPERLRAVLAHELGHLVLGHVIYQGQPKVAAHDVQHYCTRMAEIEADLFARQLLLGLGHDPEDLADALFVLEGAQSKHPDRDWFRKLHETHASAALRAARIRQDEVGARALARFETGLAYAQCRRHSAAVLAFDEAHALVPELHEAPLNAALSALQEYYDMLPAGLQDAWLRPTYGPLLVDVPLDRFRGIEPTDEDRVRWGLVRVRIAALAAIPFTREAQELEALSLLLAPGSDLADVRRGVELSGKLVREAKGLRRRDKALRIRLANNLALGQFRMGDPAQAARSLYAADTELRPGYDRDVAINLARLAQYAPQIDVQRVEAIEAIGALASDARGAGATFELARTALFQLWGGDRTEEFLRELQHAPARACHATRMVVRGADFDLFADPFDLAAVKLEGKRVECNIIADGSLRTVQWQTKPERPDVIALMEGDRLVRMTAYEPGAYAVLMPRSGEERAPIKVTVGMTDKQLKALLFPGTSEPHLLFRANFLGQVEQEGARRVERWLYAPGLSLGFQIKGDTVSAITVTSLG